MAIDGLARKLAEWVRNPDRATKDVLLEDGMGRVLRESKLPELIAAGQRVSDSIATYAMALGRREDGLSENDDEVTVAIIECVQARQNHERSLAAFLAATLGKQSEGEK